MASYIFGVGYAGGCKEVQNRVEEFQVEILNEA